MCHSIWEKICFASPNGWIRIGAYPISFTMESTSSCPIFPSTFGSSYSPAKSPFAGLFRIATFSSSLKIRTVFFSIFRGFALLLTGICPISSCFFASQKSFHGHSVQSGAPFGTQIVAPSSMSAWLNAPARFWWYTFALRSSASPIHGNTFFSFLPSAPCINFSNNFSISLRNDCFMISVSSAETRVKTRSTFPSTAGTGIPYAIDATAPAV